MMCLVCGKTFPKQQDLDKHMNTPSGYHYYSQQQTTNLNFFCRICQHYFAKKEHLDQHIDLKVCYDLGIVSADRPDLKHSKVDAGLQNYHRRKDAFDAKTIECMVCGKLFPRGAIDLQRHATAITLKHLISKKKSSMFPYGCSRCGLFFTSLDHVKSHEQFSTCNPNIVWPDNANSTSGLRAILRPESEGMGESHDNSTQMSDDVNETPDVGQSSSGFDEKRLADNDASIDSLNNATRHKRAKIIIPEGK